MKEKIYDVAIVGSGPAGYSAAFHAVRIGLDTLVFQGFEVGGQIMLADVIDSYPGIEEGVLGQELSERLEEQAAHAGARMIPENAIKVDLSTRPFRLWSEDDPEGKPVLARSIVVATGAKPKRLGVEGEVRLMGRGVSTCATCDGFFYKDREVAVVGGRDKAMEEALYLTRFASNVTIVHRRSTFRASKVMLDRARSHPKISFIADTTVEEILGENAVEGLRIWRAGSGREETMTVDGVFVAVGSEPHLGPFKDLLETDEAGYVVRSERTMTSVPGVFAAGEVADKIYRQIATVVGDGCTAALDVGRWLEHQRDETAS